MDGKHVVFGEVKKGMGLVRLIESKGSGTGTTNVPIMILDCNELKEGESDGIVESDDGVPDWPDDLEPTVRRPPSPVPPCTAIVFVTSRSLTYPLPPPFAGCDRRPRVCRLRPSPR